MQRKLPTKQREQQKKPLKKQRAKQKKAAKKARKAAKKAAKKAKKDAKKPAALKKGGRKSKKAQRKARKLKKAKKNVKKQHKKKKAALKKRKAKAFHQSCISHAKAVKALARLSPVTTKAGNTCQNFGSACYNPSLAQGKRCNCRAAAPTTTSHKKKAPKTHKKPSTGGRAHGTGSSSRSTRH